MSLHRSTLLRPFGKNGQLQQTIHSFQWCAIGNYSPAICYKFDKILREYMQCAFPMSQLTFLYVTVIVSHVVITEKIVAKNFQINQWTIEAHKFRRSVSQGRN